MMKFVIFALLFIGFRFANAQNNLLDLENNSLFSSIKGLLDSLPTLVDDPEGALEGLLYVFPGAIEYTKSAKNLSVSVNKLAEAIRVDPDTAEIIIQNLDLLSYGFNALIPASNYFSQSVNNQISKPEGNVNLFGFPDIDKSMYQLAAAEYKLSSAIQEILNGFVSGSSTDLSEITAKVEESAAAKDGIADAAASAHGLTALIFGLAADAIGLNINISKLSDSIFNLADAFSSLSITSYKDLISALRKLAQAEANASKAFDDLTDFVEKN